MGRRSHGVITSLLRDILRGASPETLRGQQMMQIDQRRDRHARGADLHPRASDRVQHPARHHRDDAGRRLDVDNLAASPLLAVVPPQSPTMQRMPAIVDDHLMPDMGRMTP
jgi:hypothetical protein